MKIKKIMTVMAMLAIVVSGVGCGSNSKDSSVGSMNKVKKVSINNKAFMAGFENEKFGITVGYAGTMYYTNDGGDNWTQGNNKSYCRFGLEILNDKVAICSGNKGHVRKTTDGGANWTELADYGEMGPNQCRFVSFVDENNGWIAAPHRMGITTDGGKSFSEAKLPDGIGKIACVELLSKDTGYLVDDKNILYKTSDGGQSWENQEIEDDSLEIKIYKSPTVAMKFLDEDNGYLYYTKDDKVYGLVTSDGGKSWGKISIPEDLKGKTLYLSNDAKYLSVMTIDNKEITILKKD